MMKFNKYDFEDSFISKLEMKRNVGFYSGSGRGRGNHGPGDANPGGANSRGGEGPSSGGRSGANGQGSEEGSRNRKPKTIIRYVQAPAPKPKPAATTTATPKPTTDAGNPHGTTRLVKGADGKLYRVKDRSKTSGEGSGHGRKKL